MASEKCILDAVPVFVFKSHLHLFANNKQFFKLNSSNIEGIFPFALENSVISQVHKSGNSNFVKKCYPFNFIKIIWNN